MKTIDLSNAKELQSVCKEKNIEMHENYFYWWKDCPIKDCNANNNCKLFEEKRKKESL